jgi:hypothetical protein
MYSSIPDEDYNFTAGVDISTICWILWGGGGWKNVKGLVEEVTLKEEMEREK